MRGNVLPTDNGRMMQAQGFRQFAGATRHGDNRFDVHTNNVGIGHIAGSSESMAPPTHSFLSYVIIAPMPGKTTFGQRAQAARKAMIPKLTQVEASAELDISRGFLAGIETDKDVPSIETLAKMAKLYGVSMDYLKTGTNAPGQQFTLDDAKHAESIEVAEIWPMLDKAQRDTLTNLMRVMVLGNQQLMSQNGSLPKASNTQKIANR